MAEVRGEISVQMDGRAVRLSPRAAEMIRQLVEFQDEFGEAMPHGDVSFRLQPDRVKMAITRVKPARRLAP